MIPVPQIFEVVYLSAPFHVRNPDQAARIAEREGAQQQRIDYAKDCRAGSDTEAGDENREHGEPGIAPHASKCVAQILRQIAPPTNQPHAAGFFRFLRHIAELSPCRRARFYLWHAARGEVLSQGVNVELHLFPQQPLPFAMGEQKP